MQPEGEDFTHYSVTANINVRFLCHALAQRLLYVDDAKKNEVQQCTFRVLMLNSNSLGASEAELSKQLYSLVDS